MKVLYPGHRYQLAELDKTTGMPDQVLQFVQRQPHHAKREGTTNQEVCRALIDRVKVLDAELPWEGNKVILRNFREVILFHEIRAFQRKHEKAGRYVTIAEALFVFYLWKDLYYSDTSIEKIPVNEDGHWEIG